MVLVEEVKRKDFTSKAAVDAALAVAGAANDFRPDDDDTPGPFGAAADVKPVKVPATPAAAAKLAETFEAQGYGAGATGDHDTDDSGEAGGPGLAILVALAQFVLGRLLDRWRK